MAIETSVSDEILVSGVNCFVRVGNNAVDAQRIGYVDSFRATKNIQLQEANCLGEVDPVSIDAVGVRVSLSLSGFLASKKVYEGTEDFAGKGKISLSSFNPDSAAFKTQDVVTKFPYMDFYDEKTKSIVASFSKAMSESFGISGNAGAYVKIDTSMRAIKMSAGSDYTTTL